MHLVMAVRNQPERHTILSILRVGEIPQSRVVHKAKRLPQWRRHGGHCSSNVCLSLKDEKELLCCEDFGGAQSRELLKLKAT